MKRTAGIDPGTLRPSEATRRCNPGLFGGGPAVPAADVEPGPRHEPEPAHGPEAIDAPVVITVHSFRHKLADPDGLCCKWVIDALVAGGVLRDDRAEFVAEVRHRQTKVPKTEAERTLLILEVQTCPEESM